MSVSYFCHNAMTPEINYRIKNGENTNTWRLYNMILKSQWDNKEIKEDIKKKTWYYENENTTL